MAKRRSTPRAGRSRKNAPVEIPMTDLDAALEEGRDRGDTTGDVHAAGTPGGGSAYGGLAGTNIGNGDPDNANLEDAMGSGVRENNEPPLEVEEEVTEAFGGISGGAVGGSPANKRSRGGHRARFAPDEDRRGDSSIGSEPNE